MQEVLYVKNNEGDVKAGDCSKNNNEGDVKHLHGLRGKHFPRCHTSKTSSVEL